MSGGAEGLRNQAIPFIVWQEKGEGGAEAGTRAGSSGAGTQGLGSFVLTEEAKQVLRNLEGPIALISVVGVYRTGKSFFLNRILLDQKDGKGFPVGSTVNACTKGLWLWSEPLEARASDGSRVQLLVVDTEGLASLEANTQQDSLIFAMALLLSSFFVYNSVGTISESALDNLSLVVNLTKLIRTGGGGAAAEEEDGSNFGQFFPKFLWIVRDFTLQLVDERGREVSSKQYLESALADGKGFSEKVVAKNRIRSMIKAFFPERDCFPMVRPVEDEKMLQNLNKHPKEALRPEFVRQMETLRSKILNSAEAKTMKGARLSGSMLLTLAQSYIDAINKGSVPSIQDAWSNVCSSQCQKEVDKGIDRYREELKELNESLPIGAEELEHWHQTHLSSIRLHFSANTATFQPEQIQGFKEKMEEEIQKLLAQISRENDKRAKESIGLFLSQAFSKVEDDLAKGRFEGWSDFDKARRAARDSFVAIAPKHPSANQALVEYLEEFTSKAAAKLSTSLIIRAESAESKANETISAMKLEVMKEKFELEKQVEEMKTLMELQSKWEQDRPDPLQEENVKQQLEAERADHRNEIDKLKAELAEIELKLAHHTTMPNDASTQLSSEVGGHSIQEDWEAGRKLEQLEEALQLLQTEKNELVKENAELKSSIADHGLQVQALQPSSAEEETKGVDELVQQTMSAMQLDSFCSKLMEIQTSICIHRARGEAGKSRKLDFGMSDGSVDPERFRATVGAFLQELQDAVDDIVQENQNLVAEKRKSWSSNNEPLSSTRQPCSSPGNGIRGQHRSKSNAAHSQQPREDQWMHSEAASANNICSSSDRSYLEVPESFNSPLRPNNSLPLPFWDPNTIQGGIGWREEFVDPMDEALESRIQRLESNLVGCKQGSAQALGPPRLVMSCRIPGTHTAIEKGKSYTLYHLLLHLSNGQTSNHPHRFSEFRELHKRLRRMFPHLDMPKAAADLFSSNGNRFPISLSPLVGLFDGCLIAVLGTQVVQQARQRVCRRAAAKIA